MDTAIIQHSESRSGFAQEHNALLSLLLRVFDLSLILGSLYAAIILNQLEWNQHHLIAGITAGGLFSLYGGSFHIYKSWRGASYVQILMPILVCWSMTAGTLILLAYVGNVTKFYSNIAVTTWIFLALALIGVTRLLARISLCFVRSQGFNYRRVAVLGMSAEGDAFARYVNATPSLGLRLVGFYDDRNEATGRTESSSVPWKGRMIDLLQAVRNREIDQVYVAVPLGDGFRLGTFFEALADTTTDVLYIPDTLVQRLLHSRRLDIGPVPVMGIHLSPHMGVNRGIKRLEDILLASIILPLIAVPMLVIALLVKATSPGPVLFKQRRYGLGEKMIKVWKYRSMTVCEDGDQVFQAQQDDARFTPIGAFLRRTSLDELPQFLNVLTGEMSIVGPRPHAVAHNEEYRKIVSGYMLRHKVKPGITGWAQVNGYRGETKTLKDMKRRVEHDLWYIEHWSLWLDLRIIVKTLIVGFTSTKAY